MNTNGRKKIGKSVYKSGNAFDKCIKSQQDISRKNIRESVIKRINV